MNSLYTNLAHTHFRSIRKPNNYSIVSPYTPHALAG